MKQIVLLLALASTLAAAQTPTTPSTSKPATTTAKPTVTTKSATAAKPGTASGTVHRTTAAIKLPPGVPPVKGIIKPASFVLRYQDFEIGTGPLAEPLKLYKVKYTGWLAADGKKFDSSDDHPNKEPIQFPQGRGRVIPGWDQGFEGMHIGGKRRLFIPYQLAYGAGGRPPVIPPKSDLIFDVELVAVTDMPAPTMPPGHPMPPKPAAPGSAPNAAPGAAPTAPTGTTPPPAAAKPAAPAAPSTAPSTAAPATTTPPATTSTPPPADKPVNPAQPQ
jgi:peptidylprolyl isomerase